MSRLPPGASDVPLERARRYSPRFLLDVAAATLVPGDCRLCENPLLRASNNPVCSDCLQYLRNAPLRFACELCGEPLAPESAHATGFVSGGLQACSMCAADQPNFLRATAFGLYDDLRPAVHLMKFDGVPSLGKPLGALLAAAILKLRDGAPAALTVIPVPLFRRKRSFNQSTLLAKSALKMLQHSDPEWQLTLRTNLLRRVRSTQSQFLLTPAQRRANVHGAFHVAGPVHGQDILLVDDIYTTGATVIECTRVLLAAGATSVRIATLARAGKNYAVRWNPPPAHDRTDDTEARSTQWTGEEAGTMHMSSIRTQQGSAALDV